MQCPPNKIETRARAVPDMIAGVKKSYEEKIAAGTPQRRMHEGVDVARAVRAIAEGLLDYSTGQVLNVDCGFHLRSL